MSTCRHTRFMSATAFALAAILAQCSVANAQDFSRVASTVAARLVEAEKKSVAVTDFTDLQMNVTQLGRYLAEAFQESLVSVMKGFRVIDRTHLKVIIQEAKLSSTGIIDPTVARQLGRISGVDTLVTGSITQFGDSVRLSIKLLDVATADVISMTSIDVPKTNAIAALSGQPIGVASSNGVRPGAVPGDPVNAQVTAAVQRIQAIGITLELQSCRKPGTCRLVAKVDDDLDGFWIERVRAWDQAGNEYQASRGTIGNRSGDLTYSAVSANIVAGVTTPITIVFDFPKQGQSGEEVTSLSVVELTFGDGKFAQSTQRFRNIALE